MVWNKSFIGIRARTMWELVKRSTEAVAPVLSGPEVGSVSRVGR